MTNEELLADLKQFIEATVSQQLSNFATKDDIAQLATKEDLAHTEQRLNERIHLLDEKLDTIQEAIGEAVIHTDATLQDHEHRLRRLEHKAA